MASNDTLAFFEPHQNMPPSSAFATIDTRNGYMVLDFDDTTDESAIFWGFMPRNYAGGGVTATIGWMSTDTTITGGHQARWDLQFLSITDDADDLDTKAFAAAQSVSSDEASASGELDFATITFSNGAQMDSVAAGEPFLLKLTRDANHADDDLTGDAEVIFIELKET